MPLPGWTLPGVMTIGAAQIALKTAGLVLSRATWLAGQGRLLLLYATQALAAGGAIAGVVDLSDGLAPFRVAPHASRSALPEVLKGLGGGARLADAGVPWGVGAGCAGRRRRAAGMDRRPGAGHMAASPGRSAAVARRSHPLDAGHTRAWLRARMERGAAVLGGRSPISGVQARFLTSYRL